MANSSSPSSASSISVFLDSNLDTHLVMLVSSDDTIASLKRNVEKEHGVSFPDTGDIIVKAIKVKRKGSLYHLSDLMLVKSALRIKGNRFLHIEAVPAHQSNGQNLTEQNSDKQNIGKLKGQSSEERTGLDKAQLSSESGELKKGNIELRNEDSEELENNSVQEKQMFSENIVTDSMNYMISKSKEAHETETIKPIGNIELNNSQEKVNGAVETENPIPASNQGGSTGTGTGTTTETKKEKSRKGGTDKNQVSQEKKKPKKAKGEGPPVRETEMSKGEDNPSLEKEKFVNDVCEIIPESQINEDIESHNVLNADVATDRVNPNEEPEPFQETTKTKSKSKKVSINKNKNSQDTSSTVDFDGKKRRKKSKNESEITGNTSELETLVVAASCQQENGNNQMQLDSNLAAEPSKQEKKKKRKQEIESMVEKESDEIFQSSETETIKPSKRESSKSKSKEKSGNIIKTTQNGNIFGDLETVQETKKQSSKRGSKEKAPNLPEASNDKSEETSLKSLMDELASSSESTKDEAGGMTSPGSGGEDIRAGDDGAVLSPPPKKKLDLGAIFRSTRSYKKVKVSASQSQAEEEES